MIDAATYPTHTGSYTGGVSAPFYSPKRVVDGWIAHTLAIAREAQGLPPVIKEPPLPTPELAQVKYGGPTPQPRDETAVAQWLVVETFFRQHIHLSLAQGALIAGYACPEFWIEFEPWYLASPLMKPFQSGSTDQAVKLVDAADIWNAQCPEDPITYDNLRRAANAFEMIDGRKVYEIESYENEHGWKMVTLGAIAMWRKDRKHGGKRENAGRKTAA